ncbi:putative Aminopeptidase M1 [Paratrimastix pyriformis]|uniref:Aminopeptidase M1 n=1 Tax=Paratrimastix pyriformis TaxID=342808 RepID=A0ABQ8UEW3_9EUKA|nr:putative Aminopeptidase M1 [Paratrimastix pyriformis]
MDNCAAAAAELPFEPRDPLGLQSDAFRLPTFCRPVKYEVKFTVAETRATEFIGEELITVMVLAEGLEQQFMVFHSHEVSIDDIELWSTPERRFTIPPNAQTLSLPSQTCMIRLPAPLRELCSIDANGNGQLQLHLSFSGSLTTPMSGFYRGGDDYFVTQFCPCDARRCFPCWDEPTFKAKFAVTLVVPAQYQTVECISGVKIDIGRPSFPSSHPPPSTTVLGNMALTDHAPVPSTPSSSVPLHQWRFMESPPMSTYLLCWFVGTYAHIEQRTRRDIPVRVYVPPPVENAEREGRFALGVAVKALEYFEDMFQLPYPLPKLDLIAIPDFSLGGMENWGLITYKMNRLLVSATSPPAQREHSCRTVCHEVSHMWFGDLVTPKWWSSIWLNEGFARWAEFRCADTLFPQWHLWDTFVTDCVEDTIILDGLDSSHAIEVKADRLQEISQIFDTIAYSKGATVTRMLVAVWGDDSFVRGLRHYLRKFSYANAATQDLWDALIEVPHEFPAIQDPVCLWHKALCRPAPSDTASSLAPAPPATVAVPTPAIDTAASSSTAAAATTPATIDAPASAAAASASIIPAVDSTSTVSSQLDPLPSKPRQAAQLPLLRSQSQR